MFCEVRKKSINRKNETMYPTLFKIGSMAIPSYGALVTLGYLAAVLLVLHLSKRHGLPATEMASYLLFLIVVCVAGGKLYFLVVKWVYDDPSVTGSFGDLLSLAREGGVFQGGLIAGVLFSLWYLRRYGLPMLKVGDVVGPGIALGHTLGRIGCFLGGCCWGRPADVPWAVTFPGHTQAVHPTQLYEAALNALNTVVLLLLLKRKRFDGQVLCAYIINYSIIRIFVEYFRGDPSRGYLIHGSSPWTSLSTPQVIGLAGLAIGVALFLILRNRQRGKEIT